jgi:hypothetical protein
MLIDIPLNRGFLATWWLHGGYMEGKTWQDRANRHRWT